MKTKYGNMELVEVKNNNREPWKEARFVGNLNDKFVAQIRGKYDSVEIFNLIREKQT
jgi:hypothetical protein